MSSPPPYALLDFKELEEVPPAYFTLDIKEQQQQSAESMDPEKGDKKLHARLLRHQQDVLKIRVAALLSMVFCLYIVLSSANGSYRFNGDGRALIEVMPATQIEKKLVPLEAHIMSKCPDAQDCLKMMVLPTMQRVIDKTNFTLSFIGSPTDNDGVACMHGPEECLGNIIELCAAELYPDPKISLGFTMCLTRDYQDIPQKSLVEDCALEHSVDFEKLNECAMRDGGGYGMGMLRDSVRRSTDAGVTKSCTVRLDEKIYCVRDGGKWTDCPNGAGVNDLVIAVEKLYHSS